MNSGGRVPRVAVASMISKLHFGDGLPRVARWGLQLAIVLVVPGGLVALALLWWLRASQPTAPQADSAISN
jgi:hypothetical protein